jgi:hypothetical protein
MFALRFAAVLALVVWMGGLLALGAIAAPAIFAVVARHDLPGGTALAGAIFGEALRQFHLVAYGCGAVILMSLLVRAVFGPRPRRFSIRLAIATLMLGATLYSGLVIASSIAAVQQEIGAGVPVVSLPPADPRRIAFGQLHAQSVFVQVIPLLGGLILLFWELRD